MVKCKECKTKVKKSSKHCPYCGASIKTKTKKEFFTDITIILDRSGSMSGIKEQTLHGYNDFIKKQKEIKGKAIVSLYQFDTVYEATYVNIPLEDVVMLEYDDYYTDGMTALYDAIGRAISDKKRYYKEINKIPEKTLFVIITDGEENSSKEYTKSTITSIMDEEKKHGWEFAFIGVNIDAYKGASKINIGSLQTLKTSDTGHGFATLSNVTANYRRSPQAFCFSGSNISTSDISTDYHKSIDNIRKSWDKVYTSKTKNRKTK